MFLPHSIALKCILPPVRIALVNALAVIYITLVVCFQSLVFKCKSNCGGDELECKRCWREQHCWHCVLLDPRSEHLDRA
jgi:hypothetical protein